MGFSQKLGQVAQQLQAGAKTTSVGIFSAFLKILSALFIALTVSIAGQELLQFGNFSFVLMMTLTMGLVLRSIWSLSLVGVLVFDLICVLLGMLFRMYLLMAP
ncbi:MAG: hypothetical protein WCH11_00240 [Bdellovibrio sp.]